VLNVAAGLGFAGFALAAVLAAAAPSGSRSRRARVQALLLYSVAVSFGAGLTQRDAWPFSAWPLVAGVLPPSVTHPRLVALDLAGREHAVDYRAWQPLGFDELMSWLDTGFPRLSAEQADRTAADLLDRAERARGRARSGQGPGSFDRILGPATAPYFLLHPRIWSRPEDVPVGPFVGLRLYRETWDLRQRQRGAGPAARLLVFEYRRP
jgi:hypothetical protein